MDFKKTVTSLLLISVLSCSGINTLFSQSRGETRQYKSAVSKGDMKGYEKFLKKYPNSVYAPKINHIIDSVNFSKVNKSDISSCLSFICTYPDSHYCAELDDIIESSVLRDRYIQNDKQLDKCRLIEPMTSVRIGDRGYYYYIYENYGEKYPDMLEYVAALLDKESGTSYYAMFSGKKKPSSNMIGYIIEGEIMDEETNRQFKTPEMTYLLNILTHKDFLVPISKGDIITDQAIEWWLENNKKRARKLNFGILLEESSIVDKFKTMAEFEKNKVYKVALFDIRGYTVICAQKSSSEYILVWCEPVCKNTDKDLLLNTIYFESTNSLVLYYYKGKTTFKVRVNLANKEVRY